MQQNQGQEQEANWVVRGGVATADQLRRGAAEHSGRPGLVGFSVQYQPGKTIVELAEAGQFRNAQISVSTDVQLSAAATRMGYDLEIVRSPGRNHHHTVAVPYPLPDDLAVALSNEFTAIANPAPMR